MSYFFIAIYIGGVIPAYRHARARGQGRITASRDAMMWPHDVGWELADRYCKEKRE